MSAEVTGTAIKDREIARQMAIQDATDCRKYAEMGRTAKLEKMQFGDIKHLIKHLARLVDDYADAIEQAAGIK